MIPNRLHYIHLGHTGREWKLHHHLSVMSALQRGGFDDINIWLDQEPKGEWWIKTRQFVNLQKVIPPTEIFGKKITQPAHQSDVLRLTILLEEGGVYVDTDTIFVKSYTSLLNNKFVLGQQGIQGMEGLCPAVILSEPNSVFGREWLAGFEQTFEGGPPGSPTWCTHSVYLPRVLASRFRQHITIMHHQAFFWPLYHTGHMKALFEELNYYPNAYSHHLWESSGKEYLDNLTIKDIQNKSTTFTELVKDLI